MVWVKDGKRRRRRRRPILAPRDAPPQAAGSQKFPRINDGAGTFILDSRASKSFFTSTKWLYYSSKIHSSFLASCLKIVEQLLDEFLSHTFVQSE